MGLLFHLVHLLAKKSVFIWIDVLRFNEALIMQILTMGKGGNLILK